MRNERKPVDPGEEREVAGGIDLKWYWFKKVHDGRFRRKGWGHMSTMHVRNWELVKAN